MTRKNSESFGKTFEVLTFSFFDHNQENHRNFIKKNVSNKIFFRANCPYFKVPYDWSVSTTLFSGKNKKKNIIAKSMYVRSEPKMTIIEYFNNDYSSYVNLPINIVVKTCINQLQFCKRYLNFNWNYFTLYKTAVLHNLL